MNQLKAGVVLSYCVIGINIILGLVYTPYLLRMLGQSEYGIYSLATSIIGYLTVLDLGFGNAIVRYTAKFIAEGKHEEQYKMFGLFFRLYLLIGLVALAVGLVFCFNVDAMFSDTLNGQELSTMRTAMGLMAFNLAVTFPLSIYGSIITAYENFVFQKVVNIIRILLNPLVMVVLLTMGYKCIALIVVTTIFNLATLTVNAIYCHKRLHIKLLFGSIDWRFFKEVGVYSFWIFLNAIMDNIYWSTGQVILGAYKGAATVAIYAIAIQLKTMFFMFSTAIMGVLLPKVTAMVTVNASNKELSDLFIKTGRIQYIIMGFITCGFIVFGKPFITLWAGADYDQAYIITLLLFIPSLIPLIQNTGIIILQAQNRMKFRSIAYLIISVSSIFLAIPAAQAYGGTGCAAATSLALIVGQGLVMNTYYQRSVKLNIVRFWGEIAKMSIVPIAILTIYCFVRESYEIQTFGELILGVIIFSAIYLPLFWAFSMNKYERDVVMKPIRNFIGNR